MAVGYATPFGVAGDLDALATAIGNKPNISDATEVIDVPEVTDLRFAIKVTGTDADDVKAAVESNVYKVDDGNATAGHYTITVDGDTTANIAFDDDAAAAKAALEALDSVDSVTVTGAGSKADPFVLTFDRDVDQGGESFPVVTSTDVDLVGGDGDTNITSPVANVRIVPGTTVS